MKTKKYIQILLENGIKPNTISELNLTQIEVLAKRFIVSEQVTPLPPKQSYKVGPQGGALPASDKGYAIKKAPDNTITATPMESEMTERFESKAQQGLFWARCNNSSGKTKEKWCKMAKEFSDSTSKKEYKDMPEKKHPEKTVKKKTTKENYEQFLEDRIVEMMDDYINPAMTKGNLVQSVNERKNSEPFMLKQPKKNTMFSKDEGKEMKRPIGRMFSASGEMAEETKEKERTKERTKEKDKDRKNPFQPKHKPAPKAKKEFKEQTIAPVRPGTKERTKEKDPGKKNPFQPKHKPAPKATGDKEIPTWLSWNKLGVKLK